MYCVFYRKNQGVNHRCSTTVFILGVYPYKFYPAQDNNMTLGWSIIMLKLYKTFTIDTLDTSVVVRVCGAELKSCAPVVEELCIRSSRSVRTS